MSDSQILSRSKEGLPIPSKASSRSEGGGGEASVFSGSGQTRLVTLFAVLMLVPAAVLAVRGTLDGRLCGDKFDACLLSCRVAYDSMTIVFQSQLLGRKQCDAVCGSQAETCRGRATAQVGAAALLTAGLIISTLLVCGLDAILKRLGVAATISMHRARPAYEEPVFTEEEKWRRKRRFNRSLEDMETIETKCLNCDIVVDVDRRWATGEIGGMDGAVCPKCKKVVVGIV